MKMLPDVKFKEQVNCCCQMEVLLLLGNFSFPSLLLFPKPLVLRNCPGYQIAHLFCKQTNISLRQEEGEVCVLHGADN